MSKFSITQFTGVIPATISVFDENEQVDVKKTQALCDFQLEKGAQGFYLTGSTGEGFLMTLEERKLVVETVIRQTAGRAPIVVHVGDIGTRKSIELAKHAYECGADGISSVPPFYWKFNDEDIYQYYKDISEAIPLPMIVYNIQLAGMMKLDLLMRIAELPNVKGIKYTAPTHDEMARIKNALGKDFMIYSGCDEMAFSGIISGADGIIGSFYNVLTEWFRTIWDCAKASDIPAGMRMQNIASEVIFEALKYDFPSSIRALLAWRGVDAGYSRRPFRQKYSEAELAPLQKALQNIKTRYDTDALDIFGL